MTQDGTTGRTTWQGDSLDALAGQVIEVLCDRQLHAATGIRQFVLNYLIRAILQRNAFDAAHVLAELRGHRLNLDMIIDDYIPAAAVETGDMWIRSEIDFATVTVGALRLQSLLSEATAEIEMMPHKAKGRLTAVVVVPEGEQHFLGAFIVAAQLKRLGCAVTMSFSESEKLLMNRVAELRPDMILFSCARVEALAVIAGAVKILRTKLDDAPVLALGGAFRGDSDRIREETGVDLVTYAAKDVVGFCTKRLKALTAK